MQFFLRVAALRSLLEMAPALAFTAPFNFGGHPAISFELAPGNTAAWNFLGEVLKPADALAASDAWWHVLGLDPDNAEASFHLGNRLRERR